MISKAHRLYIHELLYRFRKMKSDFFIWLSRVFLKNEGGLDLYFIGKLQLISAQLLSKNTVSEIDNDTLTQLRKDKVAQIDLNIPAETLKSIQNKINSHIEDPEHSYVRGSRYGNTEDKHYTRALKNALETAPEIKEILNNDLEKFIQQYFGANVGITSVLVWRNYHVDEQEDSQIKFSNDWHYDNISPSELKLFVNMTDVSEDHGPLHVIPYKTSVEAYKNGIFQGRKKQNDINAIEKTSDLIKHTGPAGSAVFAHASYCLHRADIPQKGNYRDMLEFQFHPAVKPLSKDWEKQSLKY